MIIFVLKLLNIFLIIISLKAILNEDVVGVFFQAKSNFLGSRIHADNFSLIKTQGT